MTISIKEIIEMISKAIIEYEDGDNYFSMYHVGLEEQLRKAQILGASVQSIDEDLIFGDASTHPSCEVVTAYPYWLLFRSDEGYYLKHFDAVASLREFITKDPYIDIVLGLVRSGSYKVVIPKFYLKVAPLTWKVISQDEYLTEETLPLWVDFDSLLEVETTSGLIYPVIAADYKDIVCVIQGIIAGGDKIKTVRKGDRDYPNGFDLDLLGFRRTQL